MNTNKPWTRKGKTRKDQTASLASLSAVTQSSRLPGPWPVKLRYPNGGHGASEDAQSPHSKGVKLYPQRTRNPALERSQNLPSFPHLV